MAKEAATTTCEGRDPLEVVFQLSENARLELVDGILGACWFDGNAPTERRDTLRQRSLAWLQDNVSTTCGHSARKLLERLNATADSDFPEVAVLLRRLLALAVVRQLARGKEDRSLDARTIWPILSQTLDPELGVPVKAARSAQGFAAIPVFSRIINGELNELIRLHVFLREDLVTANTEIAVHSHQPFAESWVITGSVVNTLYDVVESEEAGTERKSKYALKWDGKTEYKVHQRASMIWNTNETVLIKAASRTRHNAGNSYFVPPRSFHSTALGTERVSATLFYFDSSRGYVGNAPVLGPEGVEYFETKRDADFGLGSATDHAWALVQTVGKYIEWEQNISSGEHWLKHSHLEQAKKDLRHAANCAPTEEAKAFASAKLVSILWRIGQYREASLLGENVLKQGLLSVDERVELLGELGVAYRMSDNLKCSEQILMEQCELSKRVGNDRGLCRALGNLGMVYLLTKRAREAVKMFAERVTMARRLKHKVWESIGLSRWSIALYNIACNDGSFEEALAKSEEALSLVLKGSDSKSIALGHLHVARPLIRLGRTDEALRDHLNRCCGPKQMTSAMALCEEPSREHNMYLREIVQAGCNVLIADLNGYTCLDYAMFVTGSEAVGETIDIIQAAIEEQLPLLRAHLLRWPMDVTGVQGKIPLTLKEHIANARVKRGYRILLQEHLHDEIRPKKVRELYDSALQSDKSLAQTFDVMKALPWTLFRSHGRIPRSNENLDLSMPRDSMSVEVSATNLEHIVFVSYRWKASLAETMGRPNPDDEKKSQYGRMVRSVSALIELRQWDEDRVGVWVDYGCIDQDDTEDGPDGAASGKMRGVNSLAAVIRQVDAVISLVDDSYFERAWCSVEVAFTQRLRGKNGVPLWYVDEEVRPISANSAAASHLVEAKPVECAGPDLLKLSYETDRPTVKFLFLQASLI